MRSLEDIVRVDPNAKLKSFKKGDVIQRSGDTARFTLFIKKGLVRSYIIDDKGKEHIFMFAPEGWVLADLESMEFDHPVGLFIDCLEDSDVILFDKDCLFDGELSKEDVERNRHMLYRRIGMLQRRVLMLMSSPAIDRYQYFLSTYPDLIHRIPQHMIATYLGITPQALSTIRGKIARS